MGNIQNIKADGYREGMEVSERVNEVVIIFVSPNSVNLDWKGLEGGLKKKVIYLNIFQNIQIYLFVF